MISYGSDVVIRRPPAEVWPYLVERDKQALWSDVPMEPLTEALNQAGSRMRLSFGMGPIRTSVTLEYSAYEPPERLAFRTISQGGIQWDGEYRLTATDDGATRLSQQGTLRFTGFWRLAEPVAGNEIRRGEIAELEKLRSIIEQDA